MPTTITASEDLVYGQRIRQTRDGYWAERAVQVYGLDPTAPMPLLLGGSYPTEGGSGSVAIPKWSDPHPRITGCLCVEVEQYPYPTGSRDKVRVVASYGPPELVNAWKITISGSNGYKELSTDKDGKPYFVIKYPAAGGAASGGTGSGGTGSNLTDYGTAQYLAPGSIVTFEDDEYTPPLSKIKSFKSCTNSAAFMGYAAHQVLCRDIEAESFFSGLRWHVRYAFEICPDPLGWQQVFLFHDLYTGRVPSDVSGTDGSHGVLVADPYQKLGLTADFNALNLPTALLTG